MTSHEPPPRWRRLLTAAGCLAVGVVVGISWYQVDVQPGAAVVRMVFESGAAVTPPTDFATMERTVTRHGSITVPTPGAPAPSIDLYAPARPAENGPGLPMVLWIHGGGFIAESAASIGDYATMLASRGYLVAALDYALAPTAQHPVPVQQGAAAVQYLISHADSYGGDPNSLFLGGDSAGAQIASELAAVLSRPEASDDIPIGSYASDSPIRGVVLFCGLYDMGTVAATRFPALRTFLWAYTGYRDWTDYPHIDQLSTTRTATSAYPATFLSVGDADRFAPQTTQLAEALQARGVPVTTLRWEASHPGLGHEYQFDFRLPQAQIAFDAVVDFLSERNRQ